MKSESGMQITRMDPWRKQPAAPPAAGPAIFVGRYELDVGVDTISEALFLSGGPEQWGLWEVEPRDNENWVQLVASQATGGPQTLASDLGGWQVAAGEGLCDPHRAAMALFEALLQSRLHYAGAVGPYVAGLLSVAELEWVVSTFQLKLQRNRDEALARELARTSPILEAAMACGDLRPAGHNPTAWMANCPCGGQHWIMISTESNQFGCGYCRRKGGPEELRRFIEDKGRGRRTP